MAKDVEIIIKGDDTDAAKALGRTKKSLKGLADTAKKVGVGMTAAGAAITAGFGFSVKAAIDFESAATGVAKTVNASAEELDNLFRGLRDLSTEIPATAVDLARIAEVAGQLGIKTENILGFTKVMADLGNTTNLTAEEAATAMAKIANVTGLPQNQFDRMGSTLVALGNNLATTEAEILNFAQRLAGAGEISGLTEAQILAIGGAMSSVGVEAEAGGTAVQKVLLGMTEAVATTNEDLQKFASVAGVSAEEFGRAFKEDAGGAFTSFVEGLGRAGTDAFGILEELNFQDQRLIRSFLSLSGAGGLLRTSMDLATKAFGENTALTKEAALRYATAAAKIDIMKNEVNVLLVVIGEKLIPVLQSFADKLKPILKGIGDWAKEHPTLTKALAITAAAVGALMLVVGPLLIALPLIAAGIGIVGTAIAVAMGPVGLITLAVAALRLAWATNFLGIRDKTKAVFDFVHRIYSSKLGWLLPGGALIKALSFLARHWKEIFGGIRDFTSGVWDAITGIGKTAINTYIGILNTLIRALNTIQIKVPSWVPKYGGKGFGIDIPEVPTLHEGGITRRPVVAALDANEAVVPLDRPSPFSPLGGRISVVVNLDGSQMGAYIGQDMASRTRIAT